MSGETGDVQSGWSVDTLHQYLDSRIVGLRAEIKVHLTLLDERYATQTKALDAAFAAQQLAMRTALEAAEKAVDRALESAKEAVTKAENAAEKRFSSVNEFRAQLSDQATTFMPRSESESEHRRHNERIHDLQVVLPRLVTREEATVIADRSDARIGDLTDRLNRIDGKDQGISSTMGYIISGVGVIAAVLAIVASVITFTNSGRITDNSNRISDQESSSIEPPG